MRIITPKKSGNERGSFTKDRRRSQMEFLEDRLTRSKGQQAWQKTRGGKNQMRPHVRMYGSAPGSKETIENEGETKDVTPSVNIKFTSSSPNSNGFVERMTELRDRRNNRDWWKAKKPIM